jgi:excisionase family DNA binding protein
MISNSPIPSFLNVKQMALLLGLSRTSIYRLTITRGITFTKIGSNIRFSKADVLEYLSRNTIKEIK